MSSSLCPHVIAVGRLVWDELEQKQQGAKCTTCGAAPTNLWLCLIDNCQYIGCGESASDHSLAHFEERDHCLAINLKTLRIWCSSCQCEVFPKSNDPPLLHIASQNCRMAGAPSTRSDNSTNSSPMRSVSAGEESESELEDENTRPRGLTGLKNLGNTCYLNAALQCLSNCEHLSRFFFDCQGFIRPEKPQCVCRAFMKLINEMWSRRRPSYSVPSQVVSGFKMMHPSFRGYHQQDSQEFLRCFLDQIHEEIKQPLPPLPEEDEALHDTVSINSSQTSYDDSASGESDYETCDSGNSGEGEAGPRQGVEGESDDGEFATERTYLRASEERDQNFSNATEEQRKRGGQSISTKEQKDTANLKSKCRGGRVDRHAGPGGDASAKLEPAEFADALSDPSRDKPTAPSLPPKSAPPASPHKVLRPKGFMAQAKKNIQYRSIISDIFEGKLLSCVQCLTCENFSATVDPFQDLSLPIPSRDCLQLLHSQPHGLAPLSKGVGPLSSRGGGGGACGEVNQSWLTIFWGWMRRWFYGPTVTLQDCLAAFFSDDELKGDNMYSCGKCKKLRNGVKNSRIQRLPEVLCIHLKRFRHEYSCSKISTYVSFPVEGLDMSPYISDNCESDVHMYDLFGVINHHGNASGGHYTAHCLNFEAQQWFEFDDQVVTGVDVGAVMNSEAYVLFYRKQTDCMAADRQKASDLQNANEPTLLKFYVSKQWLNKFNTFAEPGPITNHDFLCPHGGVPPHKVTSVDMLVLCVSQVMWEYLHSRFGGGPPCNHLYACSTCEKAAKYLRARQQQEMDTFLQMNRKYEESDEWPEIMAVSMAWFKEWETFVRGKSDAPPGPIDNNGICILKNGVCVLRPNSDFAQICGDIWRYLLGIYGGGPELVFRQSPATLLSQATALAASQAIVPSRFSSSKAGSSSSSTPAASSASAAPVQPQAPAEQPSAVPAMSVPLEAGFSSASSSTEKVSPMSVDSGLATSMGSIDKDDDEESVSSMQSEAKENEVDAEEEDSSSELLPESREKDKEEGVGDRSRTGRTESRREEEEEDDEDSSTELLPEDKDQGRECDSEDATAVLTSDGEIDADEDGDSSVEVLPEDKDSGKEAGPQDSTPLPATAGRQEADKSSPKEEVVVDGLSEGQQVPAKHLENHVGQESSDSAPNTSLATKNSVVKRQGRKGRKGPEEVLADLVSVDKECLSATDKEDVLQALIRFNKNDKAAKHGDTSANLLSNTRRIKADMGIAEAVCNNVEAHLEHSHVPLTNSCDEKDSESPGQGKAEVREDAMFPAPNALPEPRKVETEEKDFAADLLPEDRKKDLMMRVKQEEEEEEEEEEQQEEDAITDSSRILVNDRDLVSKEREEEEEDVEAGGDAGSALVLEDKEEEEEKVWKVELEEKVDAEDFCPEVVSQDKRSKAEGGSGVAAHNSESEVKVMDAGKEDPSSDLSSEVKV